MLHRRDIYRLGALALGGAFSLALAVPGLRFLLDPLGKKAAAGDFIPVERLNQLEVGVPKSVSILAERSDGWVKYPRQPVGSIFLIRQPDGVKPPVVALASECPHLSCPVIPNGKGFLCPCHDSTFGPDGKRTNTVSPRNMDTLEVRLAAEDDPNTEILVKFTRFRPQTEEKSPLA